MWILPLAYCISFILKHANRTWTILNGEAQSEGSRPSGVATGQIARKWPKTGFPKRALFGTTQPHSHLEESPHPHSFKCGGPRAKGAEREYYEITPSSSLADTVVAFVQRKGKRSPPRGFQNGSKENVGYMARQVVGTYNCDLIHIHSCNSQEMLSNKQTVVLMHCCHS